jgi:hypothetical protein
MSRIHLTYGYRNEYKESPCGGKARPARKADNLTPICEPIASKVWDPRRLTARWPPRPVTRMALLLSGINICHNISFELDFPKVLRGGHVWFSPSYRRTVAENGYYTNREL